MLISIRGTNGSGKSTLVKTLITEFGGKPIYGVLGPRRSEAYRLTVPSVRQDIYVLGSYHTACGGCDQIQPYDLILELLAKYAARGHVVFEGVIVSSSYGRVGRFMEQFGKNAVMAFMDTSVELCISNVQARRAAAGNSKEFNSANLIAKYQQVLKSRKAMVEQNKMRVVSMTMHDGLTTLLGLFGEEL